MFHTTLPEELDIKTTGTSVFEPESVWDNNGRSYHGFKEGKYFLPNDAVSLVPSHFYLWKCDGLMATA